MQHFHSIIFQNLKELNWNAITLIATSMNTLQPYLPPTTVEALTGDPPLPDVIYLNGIRYKKDEE